MRIRPIEVEVIDIDPVTQYGGEPFEQTVILLLDDGVKIHVFDGAPKTITQDMIGSMKKIQLFGLTKGKFESSQETPVFTEIDPTEWRYNIRGEIVDLNVEDSIFNHTYDRLINLRTSYGDILLEPDPELISTVEEELCTPNTPISIEVSRLDIVGLH